MKRQTKIKAPPPIQKLKIIVSSIALQFEAISVHHQGVQMWNNIDPIITARNTRPVNIRRTYKIKGRINLETKCLIKAVKELKCWEN